MSIFATLNSELATKKQGTGLMSVKMTNTFVELIEKKENFDNATDNLLDMTDRLGSLIDSTISMGNYMAVIKKNGLQPSVCSILAYEVGFESIAGISLKDVTTATREQLSTEALGNMKETLGKAFEAVKKFFQNLIIAVKKFFAALFDRTKSNMAALQKLNVGVLSKVDKADLESFNKAEVNVLSKANYDKACTAASSLKAWIKTAGSLVDGEVKPFSVPGLPYGFDGESWKKLSGNVIEKKKEELSKLGWSPAECKAMAEKVNAKLAEVLTLKAEVAAIEKLSNNAIKTCDFLIEGKEGDNAAKKEQLKQQQANMKHVVKGLSIYGGFVNSICGDFITVCSKIKIKGEKKEEEKK